MKRRVARNSSPEDAAHREHDGHAHTPGRKLGRPGLKLCLLPYFLTTWSVLGKLRKDAGIHSQPVQRSLGLRQDGSGTAVIGGKTGPPPENLQSACPTKDHPLPWQKPPWKTQGCIWAEEREGSGFLRFSLPLGQTEHQLASARSPR